MHHRREHWLQWKRHPQQWRVMENHGEPKSLRWLLQNNSGSAFLDVGFRDQALLCQKLKLWKEECFWESVWQSRMRIRFRYSVKYVLMFKGSNELYELYLYQLNNFQLVNDFQSTSMSRPAAHSWPTLWHRPCRSPGLPLRRRPLLLRTMSLNSSLLLCLGSRLWQLHLADNRVSIRRLWN